jgi:CheY-like chemotaxis protein
LPEGEGDRPQKYNLQKDYIGKGRSGEKGPLGSDTQPLAALLPDGAGDPVDDTRETQAVSMADMMAAYLEEEKADASKPAPAAESKPKPPPQKRRMPETVRFKERNILLAEDIEANRELISMFLDSTGIKIDFAENGKQALEKFEENPLKYCLILMDVRMPVMDGYETARSIRALDEDWAKQIPIIAMTADALKEDIDQCFDAGMDDYLSKPVDADALQEKVFEHISLSAE